VELTFTAAPPAGVMRMVTTSGSSSGDVESLHAPALNASAATASTAKRRRVIENMECIGDNLK
jgi:hypothetical protein